MERKERREQVRGVYISHLSHVTYLIADSKSYGFSKRVRS
jgi:hypothetical protein